MKRNFILGIPYVRGGGQADWDKIPTFSEKKGFEGLPEVGKKNCSVSLGTIFGL